MAIIYGTNGNDAINLGGGNPLVGTDSADTIYGLDGNDDLFGLGGNDTLYGGNDSDALLGGLGNDYLDGGSGNDSLYGGGGADTIIGGSGINWLIFGGNATGGGSNVGQDPTASSVGVTVTLGATNSSSGGTGHGGDAEGDTYSGIANVVGTAGNDVITGTNGQLFIGPGGLLTIGGDNELWGGDGNDTLSGRNGDDKLYGQGGNDRLIGGSGADLIDGGTGIDTAVYSDSTAGVTVYMDGRTCHGGTAEGDTIVISSVGILPPRTTTYTENLEGSRYDDTLVGNIYDNTIYGGAGNDYIYGGAGNDTLLANGTLGVTDFSSTDVLEGGAGADHLVGVGVRFGNLRGHTTASYVNSSAGVSVNLTTGAASGGDATGDTLTYITNLTGSIYDDTLVGNADANTLIGLAGADTMSGLAGDDTYFVFGSGDVLIEAAGQGTDTVRVASSFTLTEGQSLENLVYDTTGIVPLPPTTLILLAGNSLDNTITGRNGTDSIDGKGGADTMRGLGGDDRYQVDNAGDSVIEAVGGGDDRVETSVSYRLAAGQEIEHLSVAGGSTTTNAINLYGNEFDNDISGNAASNILEGGAGNDLLNGRGGADIMRGGVGNDTYAADNLGDRIYEAVGLGTDTVITNVSYVLGAGQSIEFLELVPDGTAALNLTGNEFAQTLLGNAAANTLNGNGGGDTMRGYAGDDTYVINSSSDLVFETGGQGNDIVNSRVSYVLAAGQSVETLKFTSAAGTADLNLTGNELAQTLTGNAGDNRLDGGGGADSMTGYGGNDSYFVDNSGDLVFETAGGGNDTVFARASYALHGNQSVEVLRASSVASTTAMDLTGNNLAQTIYGNAGHNILDGKGGADTLYGYGGADSFKFSTALGSGNIDHIADFSAADDTIRLDQTIFSTLGLGTLSSSAFKDIGAAGAVVDSSDRILYDHNTGALYYDSDGSGSHAAIQFAILDNKPAHLTSADFFVVS